MKRRIFIQQSFAVLALATGRGGISCLGESKRGDESFHIEQFEDKGLSQFSYAILAANQIALVDPARDPKSYYEFAEKHKAKIIAVIETHPHADFVSGHLQIHKEKQATIYTSRFAEVSYPHKLFDRESRISLGDQVLLRAIDTPGHSPDSISVVLQSGGRDVAVFSGDGLLLGGVGRPDLREYSGEVITQRTALAKQMYHSIHQVYIALDDDVLVYPGHGAGSLCGNALSEAKQSTIGHEKKHNFAFQKRSEQEFIRILLADQPSIPVYFPYDVELNRNGAADLLPALAAIPLISADQFQETASYVVDSRSADLFRASHFSGAVNIPDKSRSESWLGTIVDPSQKFYVVVANKSGVEPTIAKAAKIGYESLIRGVIVYDDYRADQSDAFDNQLFEANRQDYLIIDVRTAKEAKGGEIFADAHNIPLIDLEQKVKSLPTDKPIAIHCASGYRSAIAASIVKKYHPGAKVFDVGESIVQYTKARKENHGNNQ